MTGVMAVVPSNVATLETGVMLVVPSNDDARWSGAMLVVPSTDDIHGTGVMLVVSSTSTVGARWPSGLERWLVQATGLSWPGSNPTAENFASELWQFRLPRFASVFNKETLKAVGPFYQGKQNIPPVRTGMCNCRGLHHS